MLAFRSEGHLDRWCSRENLPKQALVTLEQQWRLAEIWYADRLTTKSRRPTPEEMVGIFADLGLTGDFWDPRTDGVAG